MYSTDLEERMRDQSKFPEEFCVFGFSYDINYYSNDIKMKNGRHSGMLSLEFELLIMLSAEPSVDNCSSQNSKNGTCRELA